MAKMTTDQKNIEQNLILHIFENVFPFIGEVLKSM